MAFLKAVRPRRADIIQSVKQFAVLLLIGCAAVGLGSLAYKRRSADAPVSVKDQSSRHLAPDFELKDGSGKLVRLSDYRGKVVLLDFWATWCGPCNIEIPWFEEFERTYKDKGFAVLGVSMDDDGWKAITPFVAEKKINYRILLGNDKTGDQYGGLEALPTTFMIDREGRIAKTFVGLSDKKEFEDVIQKLLQAPARSAEAGLDRSARVGSVQFVRPNGS